MSMKRRENVSDKIKNAILLVAVVLTIGSCLIAVSSGRAAQKMQQSLDQERYQRMVAEEKLEKSSLQIASLESELDSVKGKIQGIQAIMQDGNHANADLKIQLESITKVKESLEKQLEEMQRAQGEAPQVKAAP